MSAIRYTPGPWRYYSGKLRPQFSTLIHEIRDQDGNAIVKWGGFDGVNLPLQQISANAQLIAAAPDLLAALLAYQAANRIHNDEEAELYDEAKAAIIKAIAICS